MNLKIEGKISVRGISESGDYFVVTDSIGFSGADGDPGYNRSSTVYQDTELEQYPKISEAVVVLYAHLNKFNGEVPPADVTGTILRTNSDAVDYNNVAYDQRVYLVGDGWYTIYAFLLPVDDTESHVYYDSATHSIMEHDIQIQASAVVGNNTVEQTKIDVLVTPTLEKELSNRVGTLADIGKQKGPCTKEYRLMQQSVLYVDSQLMGAKIQFESGKHQEAQETVEDITNGDAYVTG